MNSGFAFNQAPHTNEHFVVGDFIVVDTSKETEDEYAMNPKMRMSFNYDSHFAVKCEAGEAGGGGTGGTGLRFDERFLLKEDYDFTAQHLEVEETLCISLYVSSLYACLSLSLYISLSLYVSLSLI